jgi:hypothetical protein
LIRIQPEFDIWIPTGVIANMIHREKVKLFIDGSINNL